MPFSFEVLQPEHRFGSLSEVPELAGRNGHATERALALVPSWVAIVPAPLSVQPRMVALSRSMVPPETALIVPLSVMVPVRSSEVPELVVTVVPAGAGVSEGRRAGPAAAPRGGTRSRRKAIAILHLEELTMSNSPTRGSGRRLR